MKSMKFKGYKWARYQNNEKFKSCCRLPSFHTFQELEEFNEGIEKANKKFGLDVKPIMPNLKRIKQ